MKEKIMNVKNILKIIISIFIIFNMVKNCSKAAEPQPWEWEDLVDFATQVTTNQPSSLNSAFLNVLNRFTSNPNSYKDAITNAGILTQNYHNFLIYNNNNNLWFYMFNYTNNSLVSFGSSDVWFYNVNGYKIMIKDDLTTANKQQFTNQAMYVSGTSMIPITIGLQSKTVSDYHGWFFEQNFNYNPQPTLRFRTSTEHINVTIGNETINNVIITHKIQTRDNPIWRNNRKLQPNTYMAVELRSISNNA